MKIEYDQQADAIYIRLKAGTVAVSDEIRPGVFLILMRTAKYSALKCWM